jgi:thiol-disulfide isomerase/thioredoxin
MAATPSTMVSLGTPAPMFTLTDVVSGKTVSLPHRKGAVATVIMFICNHCPYVKHINQALVKLAGNYQDHGISFIAISSNDATTYPEDGPEKMKTVALHQKYPFPYLYDETQEVARAFDAACTPDFFVYDKNLKLVYRGQFDDSRPGNTIPVTGNDLRQALDCVVANKPVSDQQKPSIGCNIKWKQ